MSDKFIICVDLGTMGTKAAIVSIEGKILAKTLEESKLYYPKPGWVEQKPNEIFNSTLNTIKTIVKETGISSSKIAVIGISGQMAGIMGIDRNWKAVTHYDSWLDNRCQLYVEEIKSKGEERYITANGMPVTIAHAAKILWWKNQKSDIYNKIYKFIQPAGYVAGKLSGLKGQDAFIDYTYLHFSGVCNNRKMKWSKEMLNLLGISLDKMPNIVKPWDVVGELCNKAAEKCGLKAGIPIVAGAGDAIVSFIGSGLLEPGILIDLAGTASILACCVEDYRPDIKNKTLLFPRSVNPNYWYPHAYIGGGGLCLRWFRDTFATEEKEKFREKGVSSYYFLDEMAAKITPGSDGLVFLPHLAGRTYPTDSKVKGIWIGFSWSHKKAHFYRSILESIAYEYRYYFRIIKELFPETDYSEVRVIGGGCKSNLWNQIKADVLGIPYVQINEEDVGLIGLAMTAAKGVGLIDGISKSISNIIKPTVKYKPRDKHHKYYQNYADLYEDLFKNINPTFSELSRISELPNPQESGDL